MTSLRRAAMFVGVSLRSFMTVTDVGWFSSKTLQRVTGVDSVAVNASIGRLVTLTQKGRSSDFRYFNESSVAKFFGQRSSFD